jgi:hypothetical protein
VTVRRSIRAAAWLTATLALVSPSVGPAGADGPQPRPTPPATIRTGLMATVDRLRAAGPAHWTAPDGQARNFEVLGHHDLGGDGFNADIWVHGDFAYVGVWGRDPTEGIDCPATGVKVVDVSDPAAPALVAVLQNPELTTGEDVVVRHVSTPFFTGDLAVVGIQACGGHRPVFRGLQFFDVTNPAAPVELGRWEALHPTVGCHEVDLVARSDGLVLAGCAIPFAEHYDAGEPVVIVDATDPAAPVKAGTYYDPLQRGFGCVSAFLAHSVRFADGGRRVYVSYWDSGTVELDVSDPARPSLVERTLIDPPDEDGNNHSMTEAGNGRWLIINPEDTSPDLCGESFGGWGEANIYERIDGANRFLGTFSTPHSRSTRTDGIFTVHNTELLGRDQAFSSWYSDGIRWWEFDSSGRARARGLFVPTAVEDPHGYWPTVPVVWGVAIQPGSGLVLASDINSGLWIVQPIGL